jgi:hypothetical protein
MQNEMIEQETNVGGTVIGISQGAGDLITVESQRAQAEVQAKLVIAAKRPRDEPRAIQRIENACQRRELAECSEYAYSRGGTEIVGASIHLVRAVASYWGNIDYGFRVLSSDSKRSSVKAYAWDLENNVYREIVFDVAHVRSTKHGTKALTDDRDIYELVANMASRRIRRCLEDVIPADVISTARAACQTTLEANFTIDAANIKKLLDAFDGFGVTRAQIAKRIGRELESMQPAQMIALRKIYQSIKDGMSNVETWFEVEQAESPPEEPTGTAKDKIAKRAAALKKPKEEAPVKTQFAAGIAPGAVTEAYVQSLLEACTSKEQVASAMDPLFAIDNLLDSQRSMMTGLETQRLERLAGGTNA